MSRLQVLQIENQLLREELDTLRGRQQPYRVIERATGRVRDLETAQRVMDHLFAVGGLTALQRFWVYKNGRRVRLPAGGEAGELAAWLDQV